MKTFDIKFFISVETKDGDIKHITINKTYKAKDVEHLKEKANKFLTKLYNFKDLYYNCDNYEIKEVAK